MPLFYSPYFWSCTILVFILLPSVAAMLFGKRKGHSAQKTWAYRETGVEIATVLVPFILYSFAHILNGSFLPLLLTPELAMAALLLAGITIVNVLKASSATGGAVPSQALLVLNLCAMVVFMLCTGLVFWLTLAKDVHAWFSLVNSGAVVLVVWFAFGVSAALNYLCKHPQQVSETST